MRAVSLAVIVTLLAPGLAAADTYRCDLKVKRDLSWVPTGITITHDPRTHKVSVIDVISQHFLKKPVAGKVAAERNQRIVFAWTIPEGRNEKGERLLPVDYQATFDKGGGAARILAEPAGADKHYWSDGTCRLQ